MEVRFLAMCVVLLLQACTIRIPDGVLSCESNADCPPDFRCSSESQRCVLGSAHAADGGGAGRPEAGVDAAADGGGVMQPDSGVDAAVDGGDETTGMNKVPAPTFHGFTTSGATALDGFEKGGRVCTTNGRYCLTGAFEP